MTDPRKLAKIFKLLSVRTRVRIVQLLKEKNYCVNALADRLNLSPSAVSQHLRVLRAAGLVVSQRHGYRVHYRVSPRTLATWRELMSGLLSLDSDDTQEHD